VRDNGELSVTSSYTDVPILAIAGMEAKLLTGPPRALRRAAAELSTIRAARLHTGQTISDDEVGRILIANISSYQGDRRIAQREREATEVERARAIRVGMEASPRGRGREPSMAQTELEELRARGPSR
jgi:hypothetical protein